ncbi:MAG TPA: SGNH/GDSL hydrolase family protein [Actinomycetota bacterium]|nr:SGNH/GDSL hydrolase family protein [Actinomycetota bacterium]
MNAVLPDVIYAALGDSMSIDEYAGGPSRGAASLLLRNRDDDFPAWRGRDLASRDRRARMHLLASDGATATTVAAIQLPSLRRLGRAPTMASVTMGGNDLLVVFGDSSAARHAIRKVIDCGRAVLGGLRELMAPDAPILIGTVYDPSDGRGGPGLLGLPPWPDVLDLLAELNLELRALAAEYGAFVADLHARCLGHGLAVGDPGQPAARPANRDLWYRHLIEPNAWGASEIRAAFWEALEAAKSA